MKKRTEPRGRRQGAIGTYVLEERLRYSYAAPVRRLRQRLMVVPRAVHGSQVRSGWSVSVSGCSVRKSVATDSYGNEVVELKSALVEEAVEFCVTARVDRRGLGGGMSPFVPSLPLGHFLAPTALTEPDRVISAAAFQLSLSSSSHLDFAEQACAWAKAALAYGFGATGVRTTASDALAGGLGVCQDYAHIMLALCRAGSVPARYVSGHLMGEGGSHAWVEALVPRAEVGSAWAGADAAWGPTWEAEQGPPVAPNGPPMVAVAFDPTHNRRADHGYLTVAVGRDYGDVAPTSGTFDGPGPGALSVAKSLKFVVFEPVPTQLCFGQLGSLVSSAIAP